MLTTLFLLIAFFSFDLESNEDVSAGKSDDDGSGSRFTLGSCLSSFFELSVDCVSGFSCNVVTKFVCCISRLFSVSC